MLSQGNSENKEQRASASSASVGIKNDEKISTSSAVVIKEEMCVQGMKDMVECQSSAVNKKEVELHADLIPIHCLSRMSIRGETQLSLLLLASRKRYCAHITNTIHVSVSRSWWVWRSTSLLL